MDIIKQTEQIINTKSPIALLGALVVSAMSAKLTVDFFQIDKELRFTIMFAAAYFVFFAFLWFLNRRIKRPDPKKLSIIVAIKAETEKEKIRIKNDFVESLKKQINRNELSDIIEIQEIDQYWVNKFRKNEDVIKFNKKHKGHYYLWGDIKSRNDGVEKYFIDLNGLVFHKPLEGYLKNRISDDFSKTLPRKISIAHEFEFKGFEFTSSMTYVVSRFIIGQAALVSAKPDVALRLFKGLQEIIVQNPELNSLMPGRDLIVNKTTKYESEAYSQKALVALFEPDLASARAYNELSLKKDGENYGALLVKSLFQFRDGDIVGARKTSLDSKLHAGKQGQWHYNKIFLDFYTESYGQIDYELNQLEKKSYDFEAQTVLEVVDFYSNLLAEDDSKPQVYFLKGFIEYKKLNNLPMAFDSFSNYLKNKKRENKIIDTRANLYLTEIKEAMLI